MTQRTPTPAEVVAHLEPETWSKVNRALAAKALTELAHERLIDPECLQTEGDWGVYRLVTDDPAIEYRFRARTLCLDHLWIDRVSIRKLSSGREDSVDAILLIAELRDRLAIPPEVLPGYLQEIAATLYGAAFKDARRGLPAAELARAGFQVVETAMSEGHPIFIANNGRVGWSATDYRAYAPESANPVRLIWLAARKERADFACVSDLSYDELIEQELDPTTRAAFAQRLTDRGLDPAAYLFLPVHPWQWENRLLQLFAGDLASADLVYLGLSEDQYYAQQSIRTFFNVSRPERRYVKTSLSILNMGFTRGMSASIVQGSAAVNDWVSSLVRRDPYLERLGFGLLREVAFVGYRHRHYERAVRKHSDAYREMLAALWRESPLGRLQKGQRAMTMAALMHIDRDGAAVLPALIEASGLGVEGWVRHYVRAYLLPFVHCFYAHNLVFTPHCENVILVLDDYVPVSVIIKDIAEDIGVLNPERELPAEVRRLTLHVPEDVVTLSIFTDIFDCVFRFIAQILLEHAGYPEAKFWRAVADCVLEYEQEHPLLIDKFRRYDLFAPEFIRNCLNRLQLRNNQMMVDLNAEHPVESLQFAGTLDNPIAAFAAVRSATVRS